MENEKNTWHVLEASVKSRWLAPGGREKLFSKSLLLPHEVEYNANLWNAASVKFKLQNCKTQVNFQS